MISTIKYKSITLDVEGIYQKGVPGSYDYGIRPIEESFEIEKVFFKDSDITDVLEALSVNWPEIERIVIEQVRD